MGGLSIWHWLVVLLVAILLFGSKRLPDAARGLGRSMRIFKSEIKEMQNDGKGGEPQAAPPVQAPQQQLPAAAPPAAPGTPGPVGGPTDVSAAPDRTEYRSA
jgi:sec-independent protein translocase protein TatA